jgi:valyl-tRNA synthetase
LIVAPWPQAHAWSFADPQAEKDMNLLMDATRTIRNLRMEMGVSANKEAERVFLVTEKAQERDVLTEYSPYISTMAKVKEVNVLSEPIETAQAAHGVSQSIQVILPLAGLLDVDKERERLEKEIKKLEREAGKLSTRLGHSDFVDKAPANVVQQVQTQLEELQLQQHHLAERLAKL